VTGVGSGPDWRLVAAVAVAAVGALPGVGQVSAQRLGVSRTAHRGFTCVGQPWEVDDIRPTRFAKDLAVVR
jgi:hypothetical protein